jgi:hypothetical protein
VKAADLDALLEEFYREKQALVLRHVAGAAAVSGYDFNNTYQYVINRAETQLAWVRAALEELGRPVPPRAASIAPPQEGKGAARERAVIEGDARETRAFLDRWQPRVAAVTHARHRKMLELVLGETVEQARFFEQMLEGRDDLLGRRHANVGTGGGVLATRWRE